MDHAVDARRTSSHTARDGAVVPGDDARFILGTLHLLERGPGQEVTHPLIALQFVLARERWPDRGDGRRPHRPTRREVAAPEAKRQRPESVARDDPPVRESGATLTGPERPHLEVLRRIEDNTRVAFERLVTIDPQAALELAASLNVFWWTQGKLREGINWLARAREAASEAPAKLRAMSLFCEGFLVADKRGDLATGAFRTQRKAA